MSSRSKVFAARTTIWVLAVSALIASTAVAGPRRGKKGRGAKDDSSPPSPEVQNRIDRVEPEGMEFRESLIAECMGQARSGRVDEAMSRLKEAHKAAQKQKDDRQYKELRLGIDMLNIRTGRAPEYLSSLAAMKDGSSIVRRAQVLSMVRRHGASAELLDQNNWNSTLLSIAKEAAESLERDHASLKSDLDKKQLKAIPARVESTRAGLEQIAQIHVPNLENLEVRTARMHIEKLLGEIRDVNNVLESTGKEAAILRQQIDRMKRRDRKGVMVPPEVTRYRELCVEYDAYATAGTAILDEYRRSQTTYSQQVNRRKNAVQLFEPKGGRPQPIVWP